MLFAKASCRSFDLLYVFDVCKYACDSVSLLHPFILLQICAYNKNRLHSLGELASVLFLIVAAHFLPLLKALAAACV